MSEKRFTVMKKFDGSYVICDKGKMLVADDCCDLLNEQQELIEELHISDHMGWGRVEKFEKELKQKKIYIKRLEYKVQKFKEMNGEQQATIEQLRQSQDVKEFSALFNQSIALQREIKDLKEENEKLTKMLNANYKTNNELVQYIQMLERDNDE